MTNIEGSVVLVTGGSRGIGRALVEAMHERGAKKVYATARDPKTVTHPGAQDVTIVINNAGALHPQLAAQPDRRPSD